MVKLTAKQVLLLHDAIIDQTGGDRTLRDIGLLESAINSPFVSFCGVSPYPTLIHKAARLCYSLVMDHTFADGNKRIGAHAALVFLALNGVQLNYTQDELAGMILSVANGELDTDGIHRWMLDHN